MLFENFEAYDVQETRRISKAEARAEDITDLLSDLGDIPEEIKEKLRQEQDLDTLKKWLKLAARAKSMEQFASEIESGR